MFIAKWRKANLVTYLGVMFAIFGMYLSLHGEINQAIACLVLAGVCDMFDGKYARTQKRNEKEKSIGIQLDSLADVINFLVLPIIIYVGLGFTKWYHIAIYIIFAICGITRLAIFNVLAEETGKVQEYFKGLPVTSSAIIIPLIWLISNLLILNNNLFFSLVLLVTAFLMVLNIRIKKPQGVMYVIFSLLAVGMLILLLGM